ncbi:MAG: saccharopine dehydrogenase NADP-binding domain-containing protein [Proteobacteria bacterium]|nr:saccharopine dehydrogenase NADP-binding domain-containing protein [Pseudomonadota bacterium]
MSKTYDLVLFGATGFTGVQAAHLFDVEARGMSWAIAGRNRDKLESLKAELDSDVGVIVADGRDAAAMSELAASTRVVCSTAGPFALYSDALVAACVLHKAHYCDITGETPWVRRLIDAHHDKAEADGTKIVPMCGFDSVPSDLGAWLVAHTLRERDEQTTTVRAAFKMKAGLNGGTLASALTSSVHESPRAFIDPILLHPADLRTPAERDRHQDDRKMAYDEALGVVTAPFVMAAVNTRVVRRSNALLSEEGHGYGDSFSYQEFLGVKSRRQAWLVAAGLGSLAGLLATPPGRWLLKRFGPDPGEGPSDEQMDGGYTSAVHVGVGSKGTVVKAKLTYPGDPGNRATLRFLVSAALLLCDADKLPKRAGVLTPATAFGASLMDALHAKDVSWTAEVVA